VQRANHPFLKEMFPRKIKKIFNHLIAMNKEA
jgi:hypothetical protein